MNYSETAQDHASQNRWTASAPGRINFIGEHTDYNLGFAMPMAIDRYTTIQATRDPALDCLLISSDRFPETAELACDGRQHTAHKVIPPWSKYLAGVVIEFTKYTGPIPPLRIHVQSDVPIGSGVSSSASLEVAMAMVLKQVTGTTLSGIEMAKICQAAENVHVGVPCGLMDQIASLFGRSGSLILLDCRSNEMEYVKIPDEVAVIVTNSHVKHDLANSEYQLRRSQCESACQRLQIESLRDLDLKTLLDRRGELQEMIFRRARHVVSENARTLEAARALQQRDWVNVGEQMDRSHRSLRDDFEVSCPEVDLLVEIARTLGVTKGVYGARMTGGGFGGCSINLVDSSRAESIRQAIVREFENQTGYTIDSFVARPADGALARQPLQH